MRSIYLRCEYLQKLIENCKENNNCDSIQNSMIKHSCNDYGFNIQRNASYPLHLWNIFLW